MDGVHTVSVHVIRKPAATTNAGNDHNGAIIPSKDLAERFFPGVPVTRPLEEHEALFSNRKIREVLGFKEQHNWRQYVR